MQCRLCSSCWIYWKKYGGLKMPTRLGEYFYVHIKMLVELVIFSLKTWKDFPTSFQMNLKQMTPSEILFSVICSRSCPSVFNYLKIRITGICRSCSHYISYNFVGKVQEKQNLDEFYPNLYLICCPFQIYNFHKVRYRQIIAYSFLL